ncbi:MAG: hypothetical protein ACK55Z_10770, partial [bacterium]
MPSFHVFAHASHSSAERRSRRENASAPYNYSSRWSMHVFSTGTVFSSVARKKTECQNEAAGLETSVRRAGLASLCYTCATHSISATLTKQSGQCMCRVPYSQSSRDWRQNMPDTPYLCEDRVCTICLEQCDKPFTAKCGHALCN